jgi:hypothetical protein
MTETVILSIGLIGLGVKKTAEVTGDVVEAGSERVEKRTDQATALVFKKGEYIATRPENIEELYRASLLAFNDMRFRSVKGKYDLLSGNLKAKTSKKQKVSIRYKAISTDVTEIGIRVGTKGDTELAAIVYSQIEKRLANRVVTKEKEDLSRNWE